MEWRCWSHTRVLWPLLRRAAADRSVIRWLLSKRTRRVGQIHRNTFESVAGEIEKRLHDNTGTPTAPTKAFHSLRPVLMEDRHVTRRAVVARAGVHRNFLQRHKDLAARIDMQAGRRRPSADRVTPESLRTELATVKRRNRELNNRVQALECRLGNHGATLGPSVIENHPIVLDLRARPRTMRGGTAREEPHDRGTARRRGDRPRNQPLASARVRTDGPILSMGYRRR